MLLHNIPFIRIMLLAAITKVLYFFMRHFSNFCEELWQGEQYSGLPLMSASLLSSTTTLEEGSSSISGFVVVGTKKNFKLRGNI